MRWLVLFVVLGWCVNGVAQRNDMKRDTLSVVQILSVAEPIPGEFLQMIDEAYTQWHKHMKNEVAYGDSVYVVEKQDQVMPVSDSLYLMRLDSLHSAITLSYNDIVRNFIEMYVVKKRLQVASMLGLSEYYFPIFEEALAANCMPLELKYLPVIESALNPVARSRARACGLWQFMYYTGRQYKLEINSYIDERYDPVKSTEAAVRYLNDLYSIYNDWILVIAAYNCGPGNVNKAIRRSGGKKNYWDIYYHLPRETRGYVPAFIAAMYAFNYAEEHHIYPLECNLPLLCDTLLVNEALHFEQLSKNMAISIDELRDVNPQYYKDIIPAGFGKSYALKLPYNHVATFIDRQDTIFAYNRKKYFDDSDRVANPNDQFRRYAHASSISGDKARLVYTVRSGDVPGTIAAKFNVSLNDLKYWNNLNRRMTIRVGQKLVVYVSQKNAAKYASKAKYEGKVNNETNAPQVETIDGEFIYYTMKRGENLWTIAKKYPGVSNRDIMKWNGISESKVKDLKPGQKLKIKI
ncbi:MAG: transglycosylase SLT domain-containing protein [Odoribacter sp.]|nr:transglycosylase SLT domain-containing protein [Odoribacter sp.]